MASTPTGSEPDDIDKIRDELRHLAELVPGPDLAIDQLTITGTESFASCFDVDTAALTSAAASNLAAGLTDVNRDLVTALFACHISVDGRTPPKWSDLSGYYRTATGGFIQFHTNFPHHRAGLVARLGCQPDRQSVQEAVLGWDPDELEAQLIADGMIAARMRSLDEWAAHPHAKATAHLPLITVERLGDGPPRPTTDAGGQRRVRRVLDCSRVLAGPMAGMTLAANGAEVLRVGAEHLPSVELCVMASGFGKRNTNLDLTTAGGAAAFGQLLDTADIWIDGYRPGAMAGLGFPVERVRPGSVVVQISAFDTAADTDGPWAGRRGYDSIVQTTTGLADEGMRRSGQATPTPLPVQANDYCAGLLGAFAAQRLADHQADVGGTWLARLSLLRTRNWLVRLAPPVGFTAAPTTPVPDALHTVDTDWGRLTAARPIGGRWSNPPRPLGTAEPTWTSGD